MGLLALKYFCRYKPCSIFTPSITIVVCNVIDNENCISGHCFNIRKRRLFVRSREVSKPRDWQFVLTHRFEIRIIWVASNCGIAGERDSGLASKRDHGINPLTTLQHADFKPRVNSYIQKQKQIKWAISVHSRDLYLLKPTLGPPKKFQHLTRAE